MRLALFLAALSIAGPAAAASFDCTKAATPDERAICANPRLSALDVLVDRAYRQARAQIGAHPDDLYPGYATRALTDARSFAARKRRCGADAGCLVAAHVGALEDLSMDDSEVQVPASVAATDMTSAIPNLSKSLPTREGDCAQTRITDIGPRLEGADFESGMSVFFANGGTQMGYDKIPALVGSRKGDRVLMCLTSIPKHCPPDDDRGRKYTATNLRTHGSWSMADSQHMCGGA